MKLCNCCEKFDNSIFKLWNCCENYQIKIHIFKLWNFTVKEIEEMIVTVDKNNDGKINYSEFRVGFAKQIELNKMNDKLGNKLTQRKDILNGVTRL